MLTKHTKLDWVLGFGSKVDRKLGDDISVRSFRMGGYSEKMGIKVFLLSVLAFSGFMNESYPDEFKLEETVIDNINGTLLHELIHDKGKVKHEDYESASFTYAISKLGHGAKYRFLNKDAWSEYQNLESLTVNA